MQSVTVSPKFQIVIPQAIRQRLGIEAGAKMAMFDVDGHIELVPLTSAKELQSLLAGMDTVLPEETDRF